MKKSFSAGALLALALSFAQLPTRAEAQSGVYNWTGFYAGLHAGGAWSETKGSDSFDVPTEITRQSLRGAFGGAQLGYNYQFGRAVWGAELSGSYGQINGSGDCFINSSFLLFPGESLNCHSRQDWSLQLLTKLGYALSDGRLLPYVTGGVVLSRFGVKKHFDDGLGFTDDWGQRHAQAGAGLGAGFQYALGNGFSLGVEYLYVNFLNQDHTSISATGDVFISDQNLNTQSVRVVLNYTFGGPQPVSANSAALPGHATSGVYDWTGVYIGGHAGGEWASRAGSVNQFPFPTSFFDQTKQNMDGALGGAQLGYNHQFGRVVLGAELSGSWGNLDNTNFCFQTTTLFPGEEANCRARQKWSAQFLTRLGYAFDDGRLLPYIVGGVAVSRMNLHFTDTDTLAGNTIEWGTGKTITGAVFGAGVQYALGSGFSLGLEYLYTRYGAQDFSSLETINGVPFVASNDKSDLTTQTLRVVANYKFGDSAISDRERASKRFYDWTGFYIGANAGRGWGSATGFDEIAVPPTGDVTAQTVRGAFGGAQVGYNHQFGRVVLGTEFSASLGGLHGRQDCFATAALIFFTDNFNCRVKQQWAGQYLTRLGYAFDEGRMLPYILGGVSLAKFDVTHEISDPIGGSASWSDSRVHAGPVFGFGLQYALQNDLSLGVEYLYTPYGMQRYASDVTGPFTPPPPGFGFPGAFTQNLTTQAVRLVLNYKFDGMISGGR